MRLGLIPPVAHLETFGEGDFHLVLSHMIEGSSFYARHYTDQAKRGAWVTLDNSAFEKGASVDLQILAEQAVAIHASEIVLPDVMHNSAGTVERTGAAIEFFSRDQPYLDAHNIQLMFVPQAANIFNWGRCLTDLVHLWGDHMGARKFTIGVPKDYDNMFVGGRANLIQRFIEPLRTKYDFDVHALGMSDQLASAGELATRFPWIRSIDSVKPFTFALANEMVPVGWARTPKNPRRPLGYFDTTLTNEQVVIAHHNVAVFQQWVGAPVIA